MKAIFSVEYNTGIVLTTDLKIIIGNGDFPYFSTYDLQNS